MQRVGRFLMLLVLWVGMMPAMGMAVTPVAAGATPKILVNEFFRSGNLSTGNEWIELVLVKDMTATELEGFYVGDSTSSTEAKYSGYKFTGMSGIAASFPKGTIIVVGGDTAFAEDASYDPAGGDWNLFLRTSGSYLTSNGYNGDLAATDVVYVDTNGTYGNTAISADGFAVNWDASPGTLGSNADVTISPPSNDSGVVLTSDLAGATTPASWTVGVAAGSLTPGEPNGGANTTYINGLRTGSTSQLAVSKVGPASVAAGRAFTYTLTVANQTGAPLTDVVISDTLPLSATYATSQPAGAWIAATHTITWTEAALADAGALTYTVVVTAPATWATLTNEDYAAWATEWLTPTTGAPVVTAVKDCSSISEIQSNTGSGGASLCAGEAVSLAGIVYAAYGGQGFALAEAAGPWHGIYVNDSGAQPAVGDAVRVQGAVEESFGLTQISGSVTYTVQSSGNTPYAASVVDTGDIATGAPTAESYEGVFVEVHDATVTNVNPDAPGNYGEWVVDDDSGGVRVDDMGYAYVPTLGEFFSVVRGMLNYSFSNFKVEPRNAGDVVPGVPTGLIVSKVAPGSVQVGERFAYTLTVENQTAMLLHDVVLSDTLPLSVTYAASDPAGAWIAAAHTVTWTASSLAHGDTLTYTVVVTAPETPVLLSNADYAAWASDWLTRETGSPATTLVSYPGGVTPIGVARDAGAGWSGLLRGNVTVPPGVYRSNVFAIQDGTGGMYVYVGSGGPAIPSMSLGDTVQVSGTLTVYSGLLEMDPVTAIVNLGPGTAPDPLDATTGAVDPTQGRLIRVTGAATWSGTPPAPGVSNWSFTLDDGSGPVMIFVDLDTGIDMRGFASGQPMTVIGFSGSYNAPQVMPRYQTDVIDMRPPSVEATTPVSNATGVSLYFPVEATFNKALDTATVTTDTFTLTGPGGAVSGAVSYVGATRTAVFDPAAALAPQTRYTATLTTGIQDSYGNPLAAPYTWSFTTGDADTTPPAIVGRYPAPAATEVPLYANVVVTFSEALDPATLIDHVMLEGPYGPVPAALTYDPATWVATLDPTSSLLPTTHYTVTVDADVADWAGLTLGSDAVWSFETAVEPPMNAYHGDIHNHTSYSDGSGTPTLALSTGRNAGFDFMAITDHSYAIDDTEWAGTLTAVNAATEDGVFVALRGFEYTQGAEGHVNVYNTVRHAVRTNVPGCTYCDYTPNLEAGVTVQGFYPWLAITGTQALDANGTLMQFNHPGWMNFNDWAYHPEVGDTTRLEEVGNGSSSSYVFSEDEYIRSLDYGWKVGATNNADTHSTAWGTNTPHRTGVWMPALTRSDLLEALRERRTFATEDTNYALRMKANGAWMGQVIPNTGQILFEIYGSDPDAETTARVQLITNQGKVVAEIVPATPTFTWQPQIAVTPGVHYFYVKATQPDGDRIVSSPVWTEGAEDIALTDLAVQPSIPTIYNPSLFTARVTNRGWTTRTVTVTFQVNTAVLAAIPLIVAPCSVGPCVDGYANVSWQPLVTGPALVTATLAGAPVGDSLDDNARSLSLDVTAEKIPLILVDDGHNNIGAAPRDARLFAKDATDHGYNVLFNLDAITASDLNTETVKLLILNAYGPDQFTVAEMQAVADFVAAGGSLWLNGMSDYTGKVAWADTVANRMNGLIDAIETGVGSNLPLRINDDEVMDYNDNNGYVFGVQWHLYPVSLTTGIGLNVEKIQSWSDCSLVDRNGQALTQDDLGEHGFLAVIGDLDPGYGPASWYDPNHTYNENADNVSDGYIYNPTWTHALHPDPNYVPADAIPVPFAAGYDIPGQAGRLLFYGDSNDPYGVFSYTAGDGKQNELFNLEAVMWLLGTPLHLSTVAEARAQAAPDQPDHLDELVWIEGEITAAYGEFFNVLYVRDETGGVTVHAPAGDIEAEQYARGAHVRVAGTVGIYNGDTEIEFFEAEQVQILTPTSGIEPLPRPMTTHAASLEVNEGWLVQITGTVTSKVGQEAVFVDDGSGPVRAFLDGYNGDFSNVSVGQRVSVVGLASEDGDGPRIRVRNHLAHPALPDDVRILSGLAITKTVATVGNVFPGDTVTYTVVLSHAGGEDALNVALTDTLPPEVDFGNWVENTAGAQVTNDVITWSGTISVATEVRLVFTAVVQKNTTIIVVPVVNTAGYTSENAGSGDDTAIFDLYVMKTIYLPLIARNYAP